MKAQILKASADINTLPLVVTEIARPSCRAREILVGVRACGLCRTDLHVVEGDLKLPKFPLVPGHQVVGIVEETGSEVSRFRRGDRVGVPWLYSTCGECEFCKTEKENLCDAAQFTGYHVDGGYSDYMVAHEDFAYHIPEGFSDEQAAPLLCAGVIGFRALRLSGIRPGQQVGLYGFGASAHIAVQILKHWRCDVYVFTRTRHHRDLAVELGASWTGTAEDKPPHPIDSAVIFAPAGHLVHAALKSLKKGGIVTLAGIHMSPIPEMQYALIYEERTVRSVANSTRQDVRDLLKIAADSNIHTQVETFPLVEANVALRKLKQSEIRGSGVLLLDG